MSTLTKYARQTQWGAVKPQNKKRFKKKEEKQ